MNLFGHRRHGETSDKLIKPLQDKVLEGARASPWLNKAGTRLNRGLDSVNASVRTAKSNRKGSGEKADP